MKTVTLHTSDSVHARLHSTFKKIKKMGYHIEKTIPDFLIDCLDREEKVNFKNFIKYIKSDDNE